MNNTYKGLLNKHNLPSNGIYSFGSNKVGINGNPRKGTGGAALVAQLEFGVRQGEIMDNRLSESGKAYGITTVYAPKRYMSLKQISESVKMFYDYAIKNPEYNFYLAYDGINPNAKSLNGYTRLQLSKLFSMFEIPKNIVFEENFYKLIINNLNDT